MSGLRVGIDARLRSGFSGGVEQVVIGLASALAKLEDGNEEYLFVVHPDQEEWLRPHLRGPCRPLHSRMEYPGQPGLLRELRRGLRRRAPFLDSNRGAVLSSNGTIERAGVDLIHFPMQEAFLTDVPSIYQPHDLQHLHLPELVGAAERERRELVYRTHCRRAALVVAMTSWGKRDLIDLYGLPPERVEVVPGGSVLDEFRAPSATELEQLRRRLSLPEAFLLYPAQTWAHKNHTGLLEALAVIKEHEGIDVPLVCPGRQTDFFPRIRERVRELRVEDTTWFPGFVQPLELRGLYALARALVFPSKFEGWGLPVCEAFASCLPVASSSATGLADVVGDAGLLFDPEDPAEIADCILRLWRDSDLRRQLAERGHRRVQEFSFDRAAKLFRAHYRRLANRPLAAEDRILLATPPPA